MRIFIGGAGDVRQEMNKLNEICNNLKPTLDIIAGNHTSVVDWTRLTPSDGNAQNEIFDQSRFKETDLFVFVFWHKFGSKPGNGISPWQTYKTLPEGRRKEKSLKDYDDLHAMENDGATLSPYESGTEAEIETALAVIKQGSHPSASIMQERQKRIMVYRCNRPLPQRDFRIDQWRMLEEYFSQRLEKELFYSSFDSLDALSAMFCQHILNAAHSVSRIEDRSLRSLEELKAEYTAAEKDPRRGNFVQKYIARECGIAAEMVRSMAGEERQRCRMRTTDLYDRILDIMRTSSKLAIIDQDWRRWNELCNQDDRIYSLNYSDNIIMETAHRARQDAGFLCRRILAVRKIDLADPHFRDVLERVHERFAADVDRPDQIQNQVFVDDYQTYLQLAGKTAQQYKASEFHAVSKAVKQSQDFVLCEVGGAGGHDREVLLTEEITMDKQQSAFDTWGSISAKKDDIAAAKAVFASTWEHTLSLEVVLEELRKRHPNKELPST